MYKEGYAHYGVLYVYKHKFTNPHPFLSFAFWIVAKMGTENMLVLVLITVLVLWKGKIHLVDTIKWLVVGKASSHESYAKTWYIQPRI